ncbi:dehydrodolichyl diphosphate synthase complex subunit DHDDS [Galendromus occidentalis]|uniref:Alkyl transferase n=1 Tax=Galendromus occidentalis TaxID=34638 RepID=A0AAJ6VVU6_9ACAR|nr:dehydrodolichyl diphosphate synthase complex subunit DHDDS [Galendromus occidentalis]
MPMKKADREGLLRNYELSWLQKTAMRILAQGRIPQHVALIMDGNRRYAKQVQRKTIDGHKEGFSKLSEVLFWCRELGVTEVTVYAFSIENFKRTKDEVDALLDLAEEKFRDLLDDHETLVEHQVCIRILGNTSYLPVSLQQLCAELMLKTKDHHKCFVNIALSYTAREEMCTAIEDLLAAASEGLVKPRNFNEALLSSAMYSKDSPDPDLLIRTSGEVRLSDFLLWQTGFTVVEFIPELWPKLNIWQFLGAILHYQWQAIQIVNCSQGFLSDNEIIHEDFDKFIERRRLQKLRDASLGNVEQKPIEDIQ